MSNDRVAIRFPAGQFGEEVWYFKVTQEADVLYNWIANTPSLDKEIQFRNAVFPKQSDLTYRGEIFGIDVEAIPEKDRLAYVQTWVTWIKQMIPDVACGTIYRLTRDDYDQKFDLVRKPIPLSLWGTPKHAHEDEAGCYMRDIAIGSSPEGLRELAKHLLEIADDMESGETAPDDGEEDTRHWHLQPDTEWEIVIVPLVEQ